MDHLTFSTVPFLENPCYTRSPYWTPLPLESSQYDIITAVIQWKEGGAAALSNDFSHPKRTQSYKIPKYLLDTVKAHCALSLVYTRCSWHCTFTENTESPDQLLHIAHRDCELSATITGHVCDWIEDRSNWFNGYNPLSPRDHYIKIYYRASHSFK